MKLDWKRVGLASIAEHGEYTANVYKDASDWNYEIRGGNGSPRYGTKETSTREDAEQQCESWLEQHDRPEWHDVTDWLSWAEWRGRAIMVHRYEHRGVTRWFWDVSPNDTGHGASRDEAKAAAEKWVREQGAPTC